MPEKSQVLTEKLKHEGFWNFRELYNFCYEWLKNEGYMIIEEEYTERLTAAGKEIIIKWVCGKKISDYFKNDIELKWHILRMNDAEIEVDGKKVKTNKGEVKLTFKAELEKDYEKKWEDNPMYKFFRGIYDKYIIKTTTEEYEDRLYDKTVSFIEDVKAFLVLEGKK